MNLVKWVCFYLFFSSSLSAQTYNEILGRPTDSSITISILFDQNVQVYWEYGITAGSNNHSTLTYTAVVDTPLEVDFINLLPDTKYYYRTRYRAIGATLFLAGAEHNFQTKRSAGSTFTFTVEADEHLYDRSQGSANLYKITLQNQQKDSGDFMISLGDIFGDDHTPYTSTSADMKAKHLYYRKFLGAICHSVPFYVCLGNHEGENDFYLNQTPPNNIACYATLWRKFYYPNPYPNNFYTGNTNVEGFGIGQPQNYYAWNWGDALLVVLDIYRDQCDTSADPKKWAWTLGLPQYSWFKNILENSTAKYKFVFAHHPNGQQRGGISAARLYEWGGYEINGAGNLVYKFDTKRPGWAKPVHQLMVDNGVNIFFQGHDHLFAKEVLDGVIYQEVPMAADSTYSSGVNFWSNFYSQNVINGSGHIRVNVAPDCINVNYIQAYLPADTAGINKNRQVAFSYSTGVCASVNTYLFIGNGNWNVAANWSNNLIPPAILPSTNNIIIDPMAGGTCVLNVTQRISSGANLTVKSGKFFVIPGLLIIQ